MNELISISGIPGSGKSSLASFLGRKFQAVHISSDLIRREYFGDPSLKDFRYKKPLRDAVIKILDDKLALNLFLKNNIIYDSIQSELSIGEKQLRLCEAHGYKYTSIELLFTPSTLEKRILHRNIDPFGSEAGVDVMKRFWLAKIKRANIDNSLNEYEIISLFVEDFHKKVDQENLQILIFESKNRETEILFHGLPSDLVKKSLEEYLKKFI